jgi:YD repeat-containing protein
VTFAYDTAGRLDYVDSSDGRTVDYVYDPTSGFLTGVTGVDAKTTTIEPDASGRVVKIIDPTGVVLVHNAYDLSGRVGLQVTPQGTTSFVYDKATRTTVVTQEDLGESITYTHDTLGRVVAITDETMASVTRVYDANGWLDVGEDRRGAQVLADFDARGNPQSVTDPKTGTSTIGYDTAERVDEIAV